MTNPDAENQSTQASSGSNQASSGSTWLKNPRVWLAFLFVLGAGWLGGQTWISSQRFEQGEEAYSQGDCSVALDKFNQLLDSTVPFDMDDWKDRASARKTECEQYQAVTADSSSQESSALMLSASDFLDRYPSSALAPQLRQTVTEQAGASSAAELASVEVCDRFDNITNQQLLPNAETQTPLMLQACGATYSTTQDFDSAIAVYDNFLVDYADHDQFNAVEVALAKTMVDQANSQNAGQIPPPPLSGYTGDGSTVVIIRNDSPEAMRIVFSGTDPQFKELPPCTDCQSFTGSEPSFCPEKGPEARFVLSPGQYDVLVRSVGDRSVIPFTGTWSLSQGSEYYNCFYIVQSPVGS